MNIKQILQSLKSIFALDKNVVHLSGNETIDGNKTFGKKEGVEGGEIELEQPTTTDLQDDIHIDSYTNSFRCFSKCNNENQVFEVDFKNKEVIYDQGKLGNNKYKFSSINGNPIGSVGLPIYSNSVNVTSEPIQIASNYPKQYAWTNTKFDGILSVVIIGANCNLNISRLQCSGKIVTDNASTCHILTRKGDYVLCTCDNANACIYEFRLFPFLGNI